MLEDTDFVEKTIDSESVFCGRLLDVYRDRVQLPGGRQSVREYIRHPGAAVIIPFLDAQRILMVRQYRYPVREVLLELPAGKIDPGEEPMITIQRELAEETGYTARQLFYIAPLYPCVGYSNELLHLYGAEDLKRTSQEADADEKIEVVVYSLPVLLEQLYAGKIRDVKTVIGLFWAEKILQSDDLKQRLISASTSK